jgi:phosphoglycolate phosphatase-like HAD superfamily hydrolase
MAHDRGVILDVDGTLIDSNDAHARAWSEAGERLGHEIPFERVRPLIGMGGDRVLPIVAGVEEESEAGQELSAVRRDIFKRRYLPELRAFPGVRRLVERLRDDGFDIVVASSASADDLESLLEVAGVLDLVRSATSADDADESKPSPDIVEEAIGRANVARNQLIMLGDTPYDVEAARRARVPLVAVRCGGWDTEELEGAAAVFDDPADLLDHYESVFLDDGLFDRAG